MSSRGLQGNAGIQGNEGPQGFNGGRRPSKRSLGEAGCNYKYPTRPEQRAKETQRRINQIAKGQIRIN